MGEGKFFVIVVFKWGREEGEERKNFSRLFVYEDSSTGVLNTVYEKNKMN